MSSPADLLNEVDNPEKFPTEWESGKPETPCGIGSKFEETVIIREWLPKIVKEYEIDTINDVGCGDQNWIHEVKWKRDVDITSFDLRPRFTDVLPIDVTMTVLPEADLIMCIYVLNHVRPKPMARALRLIKESGARFLLSSYNTYDKFPFPLLETIPHKKTPRHTWNYGLWYLGDAE